MSDKVYLEFSEGTSNKFWEGEVDGVEFTTRWGKMGSNGQTKTKSFDTEAKALAALQKAVKSKTGKGYVEVASDDSGEVTAEGDAASTAAAPAASAPSAPAPVAPEPVEPAAAPASTADAIAWTDAILRRVAPVRGQAHVALPPVSTQVDELLAARAPLDGVVRAIEVLPGFDELAADAEAVFEWLDGTRDALNERQAMVAMVYNAQTSLEFVVRYAAREFGAQRACELFVESIGYAYASSSNYGSKPTVNTFRFASADSIATLSNQSSSNLALTQSSKLLAVVLVRRLMNGLSDGEHASLVERAAQMWAALPSAHKATIAALFPEKSEWAEECFEYVTTGYYEQSCAALLLLTPQSDKNVLRLFNGGYYGRIIDENYYTLLYARGPSALDLFARSSIATDAMGAAVVVKGPSAASYWCKVVEKSNESFDAAVEAMATFPVLALVGLSHVDSAISRVLTAAVASASAGALERAVEMEEANAARLLQMLPARPDELAPQAELPAVLADPPWSRKKKKAAKPVTFKDLSPPQLPVCVSYSDDERARIAKRYEYQLSREDRTPQEQDEAKLANIQRYVGQENVWSYYIAGCTPRLMTMNLLENVRSAWDTIPSTFWKVEQGAEESIEFALSRFGEEVLDVVLDLANRRVQVGVLALQGVESVEVARLMSEGFARIKSTRAEARDWIDARPIYTMLSIVPDAFGKDRKRRGYAEKTLMHIGKTNERDALLEAAREHYADEVVDALDALLGRDPLEILPKKMPKVPTWLSPKVLPPLVFEKDSSWRLSDQQIVDVLQMLTFYDPENPYPGFEQLREVFTQRSLDDFGLAVCQTWLGLDGSSKQSWALQSLAEIGHDGSVRALTPKIRKWPGESAVKRAQWGLDVLAHIGTDLALMNVYSISQKIKYKSLKAHASSLVDRIAEERGLTRIELGDRLVPDFDLDARGRLTLDYGPRQFEVSFDESLKPILKNDAGKTIKSLPKPNSKDDEEKAKEAKATLRGLKKDLKTVAKQQIQRLEGALVQQRRWAAQDFVAFLVDHPLMINLTHRLLWGAWKGDELVQTFRVDIDQTFIDIDDEDVDITGCSIGLLHPSHLDVATSTRWQSVIGDYEIIQPFDQLGRPFHPRAEALATLEKSVLGAKLDAPKLVFGLEKYGWERGPAEDGGAFYYHTRPLANGEDLLIITYEGCVAMGYIEEGEEMTIEELYVAKDYVWRRDPIETNEALEQLGDITLSEITHELLVILS